MKLLHYSARSVAALFVAVALVACTTTPDLKGWAQNSADLAGAIGAENKQVSDRIQTDIGLARAGEGEGLVIGDNAANTWEERRKLYTDTTAMISRCLDTMVLYANAIADLAAKGETGKEAATQLVGSVKGILATVKIAYPFVGPLVGVGEAAFGEAAGMFTRVQAQDALAAVMSEQQPAVVKLASLVAEYAEKQRPIVITINNFEHTYYIEQMGPAGHWYATHGVAANKQIFGQDNPSRSANYSAFLERLQTRYENAHLTIAASDKWTNDRLAALDHVKSAAEQWRQAHEKATETLVNCGGMRSFRSSCGNFTAANLKLAAERIRNILQPPKPESGHSAPAAAATQ